MDYLTSMFQRGSDIEDFIKSEYTQPGNSGGFSASLGNVGTSSIPSSAGSAGSLMGAIGESMRPGRGCGCGCGHCSGGCGGASQIYGYDPHVIAFLFFVLIIVCVVCIRYTFSTVMKLKKLRRTVKQARK